MSKGQTLRGFRDFLPQEAIKRNWLKKKIAAICELWGYDPLETPTLESLAIFKGQIGEGEKLFYQFKDPGGREVALRYDQTVPLCRVVGQYQNRLVFPFKRYQVQNVYRAEKPQKGRFREFLQVDCDIIGIAPPVADGEAIALSLDIYRRLGFPKAIVRVNDRRLLKQFPYPVLVVVDKLKKIGLQGVIQEMEKRGIAKKQAKNYVDKINQLTPNKTIKEIFSYLSAFGFDNRWYRFDPTIVRSFSYSDGPIWEIEIPGYTAGSVLGGERYDKLTLNISGVDMPGTGFGLGFDRTLEAAEQFGLIPKQLTKTRVLVTIFSKQLANQSLKTAALLRDNNINTDVYPDWDAKLEKQLKYADKKGIPYVVIIGPDELKENLVILKDMKLKSQQTLSLAGAIKKLKNPSQ